MVKISEILKIKKTSLSFELFPPKTGKGHDNLRGTIENLCALGPDFFSCTYGAGGSSRGQTFDIVEMIEKQYGATAMAHLTCVLHTKAEIQNIVADIKARGVRNILALRGDPPQDRPDWQPGTDNFRYSSELVAAIRAGFSDDFSIGVAGFPEGHLLCPDRERDADYLKMKIDAGADFVITQIFFDNRDYFAYVGRLRERGVTVPVLPGILPVTSYDALLRFTALCGAAVPDEVRAIFEPRREDPKATLEAGIDFCLRQCRELLRGGAPGLHFYTLNKLQPVKEIITRLELNKNPPDVRLPGGC
jgi:methylenetetrahydrofolate reductase (NADPH)